MLSGKTCFITVSFNDSDAKKHSVSDRIRQKVIFSEFFIKRVPKQIDEICILHICSITWLNNQFGWKRHYKT